MIVWAQFQEFSIPEKEWKTLFEMNVETSQEKFTQKFGDVLKEFVGPSSHHPEIAPVNRLDIIVSPPYFLQRSEEFLMGVFCDPRRITFK